MKYLKMLGLVAIAAAALTAYAGVGSASAYTLCKTNVTSCPATGHYVSGQVFEAEASVATLTLIGGLSGQTALNCKSKTSVKQTSTGDNSSGAVSGEVTNLEFTSCVSVPSGFKCEVSKGSGYVGSIVGHEPVNGNGTLSISSPTSTKVECASGFLNCTFTTPKNGASLAVTGNNPAIFKASEVVLGREAGGIVCPKEAKWDAEYSLSSPTALFVTK